MTNNCSCYSLPFIVSCLEWPEECECMFGTTGLWAWPSRTPTVTVTGSKYSLWTSMWTVMEIVTLTEDKTTCSQMEVQTSQLYKSPVWVQVLHPTCWEHFTECKQISLSRTWCWCWCGERGFFILSCQFPIPPFPYSSSGDSCSVCLFVTYNKTTPVLIWLGKSKIFCKCIASLKRSKDQARLGPILADNMMYMFILNSWSCGFQLWLIWKWWLLGNVLFEDIISSFIQSSVWLLSGFG